MIRCINYRFDGGTSSTTPISSYDPNKINFGSLMRIYSGTNPEDKYIGPMKIGLARPMEASTPIPGVFPYVITFSETIDWVFLFDNAAAAVARRVILYEYNKITSEFNWLGFVTLNFPTTGNHTIRGGRISRNLYTDGTVSVSGTSVTGNGTLWSSSRISVGCRIGFGSTDPTQITNWDTISAVGGDTSITLENSVGTISAGTPYVIEDIIIVLSTTNSILANGGLFVTKGISYNDFSSQLSIPAATTVDNIKAVYWIADAATVTNTTATGCAIDSMVSWTEQYAYVINSTSRSVYVYNFRKALSLTSGKDSSGSGGDFQTGTLPSFTGTLSILNNGRITTLNHGPGSGVKSLYFVTTTRVYRSDLSSITNGNTSWTSDIMVEIPPGGASTYPLTGALSSVENSDYLDRLIVMSTGAAGARSYVTRYNTASNPFDHIFLVDDKQLDQSLADSGSVPHPSINAGNFSVWSEGGILYLARIGVTAIINNVYAIPMGAHRFYSDLTGERIITPKFDISNSTRLYNVYVNSIDEIGSDTFSLPSEPYNLFYRTSGISDNSGSWIELDQSGDLSNISGSEIQFSFTFKTLGTTCIPSRLMGISIVYEDESTDSHYEPSVSQSSISNRIFSWRQGSSWGGTIPNLRIKIWNIDLNTLVLEDTTDSSISGVWEFSTDNGNSWSAWDPNSDSIGNYIRYVANSIPNGIRTRVSIIQA